MSTGSLRVIKIQDKLNSKPIDSSDSISLFENREWLRAEDAALYLGISLGSLRNMTSNGELPYYKLGRRILYRTDELRDLLLREKRGGN